MNISLSQTNLIFMVHRLMVQELELLFFMQMNPHQEFMVFKAMLLVFVFYLNKTSQHTFFHHQMEVKTLSYNGNQPQIIEKMRSLPVTQFLELKILIYCLMGKLSIMTLSNVWRRNARYPLLAYWKSMEGYNIQPRIVQLHIFLLEKFRELSDCILSCIL